MENPLPALRMFAICESMKWTHLPVAGGLYDQHPDLLDAFAIIFSERSKFQAKENERMEREARVSKSRAPSRRR